MIDDARPAESATGESPEPEITTVESLAALQAEFVEISSARRQLETALARAAEQSAQETAARDALERALAAAIGERDRAVAELRQAREYIAEGSCVDQRLQDDLLCMLRRLEPVDVVGFDKRRIGRDNDGGYVMLDDFAGVEAAYSFGIFDDVSWDLQIAELGLDVFQYDHTIDALPSQHDRFHWRKLGIGPQDDPERSLTSIETLLRENGHTRDNSLVLKMDIEDAEWDALGAVDPSCLRRFRQIVVEMHWFHRVVHPERFHRMLRAISALTVHHRVIHVHGNNYAPWATVSGVALPRVIEFTFVCMDGKTFKPCESTFPTSLDMPNHPGHADFRLGHFRF